MPRDRAIDLFRTVATHHGVKWTYDDSPKFGSNALRANGKIYAALTRSHRLLLKLPPARVKELLDGKRAEPMESGGRVMNGWITLTPDHADAWTALSDEARAFATTQTKRKRKSP
ncbi:MAG: hypothetical protein J0H27_16440 [Xanthomonadales bacterium]|nr:hypothetical protein [Xanthomonadales bacterium]ODU91870.1 MAG: hypothetical protein ABT18_14530 [Rhodanobacter sp. SCN 66-43]OJY84828.1 MAG: hypothetical protein BGP23_02170 [Xanthomonadales bacterium 66-474]